MRKLAEAAVLNLLSRKQKLMQVAEASRKGVRTSCHKSIKNMKEKNQNSFASQNAQNTSAPEPFLKFRSGKMARRCGAKRICTSKCTKHLSSRPIFPLPTSKNGTPLWREASKCLNPKGFGRLFEALMSKK